MHGSTAIHDRQIWQSGREGPPTGPSVGLARPLPSGSPMVTTPNPPPSSPPDTLERIEARLARIEAMMTPLAQVAAQLPQTAAVATDALDEWAQQDGQLDARLAELTKLAMRVSEPATVRRLRAMLDHLDALPDLVATGMDVIDEASGPVELSERVTGLAKLVERASRPKTIAQATLLLEKLEALPEVVATGLDALDDWAAIQGQAGVDLEQILAAAREALKGLANLATAPQVRDLLDSGLLSPEALDTLGAVARAMAQTRAEPTPSVGMLGALSAMRDQDVQRALGFVITLGRAFGQQVNAPPALKP